VLPTCRLILYPPFFWFYPPHLARAVSSLVRGGVLPTHRLVLWSRFLCFAPPSRLHSLEPSSRLRVAHTPLRSMASISLFRPPTHSYTLNLVRGSVLPTRRLVLLPPFLCFTIPSGAVHSLFTCSHSLEPSPRRCIAHTPLRSTCLLM
jgi:hypothetical protein